MTKLPVSDGRPYCAAVRDPRAPDQRLVPAALAELPLAQWQVICQLVDRLQLARAAAGPPPVKRCVDYLLASVFHLISD